MLAVRAQGAGGTNSTIFAYHLNLLREHYEPPTLIHTYAVFWLLRNHSEINQQQNQCKCSIQCNVQKTLEFLNRSI